MSCQRRTLDMSILMLTYDSKRITANRRAAIAAPAIVARITIRKNDNTFSFLSGERARGRYAYSIVCNNEVCKLFHV